MPKLLRRKDTTKARNINLKFVIDCHEPREDKVKYNIYLLQVINLDEFADFLKSKIKVAGKTGNLGDDVAVNIENDSKVVLTSTIPFSKRYLIYIIINRYLKYLTKKYLK